MEDLREFRGLLSRAGRVFASPATCLCGAQRELETGRKVRGLEKRWRERSERGREREARCMESSARLDIVSRYLELCVWVFALNRRTRRKTRGLLRPRGLSYQIDAADEGARGGNWDGPRGLDHFRTSVDWSRGPGTGPIPCCPLVLAA